MSAAVVTMTAMMCMVASAVTALALVWIINRTKNRKKPDSGDDGEEPTTGCSGEWRKGGVVSLYNVYDPKDGSGSVAGLTFKPKSQFYKDVNVVAVIDRDWGDRKFQDVEIRIKSSGMEGAPPFVATVLDYCSDKDCGGGAGQGCCTRNLSRAKEFAGVENKDAALFDVEQQTLQRVLGNLWPTAKNKGVMNAEYRYCNRKRSPADYSKYKP